MVTTLLRAKYTSRPTKKLNLAASYRYSGRDNRTPINIYQFADAGEAAEANSDFPAGPTNPLGAVLAQNANANRPYSRTSHRLTMDANFALATNEHVTAGYDFERLNRMCTGSWISCADAPATNEHTVRLDWRATLASDLIVRIGYARSQRRAPTYNENAFLALVPYANVSPESATDGATALSFMTANGWNGWGPALGYAPTTGNMNVFFPSNQALSNDAYANNNRISEVQGLRRYWVADRNRDKLRSSLAWQAGDTFAFQGGFDLNRDDYLNTTYGLQNANGWSTNLDLTYTPSDSLSTDVFYTYERLRGTSAGNSYSSNSNSSTIGGGQPGAIFLSGNSCDSYTTLQQRNNNLKVDPCLDWASKTSDAVHSVGFEVMKKTAVVQLTGTLTFERARSDDAVTGGSWANNVANGSDGPPTTIAAFLIQAAPLPTVSSNTVDLRLKGTVPVTKGQAVRVSYAYLHMTSSDWMYEGMQFGAGTLSGVLPTSEQPFAYNVHVLGVSYALAF